MLAWFTSLASLARTAYRFEDREQEAQLDDWVRMTFAEIAQVVKHGANSSAAFAAGAGAASAKGAGGGGRGRGDDDDARTSSRADGDASHAADPAVALEGLRALASAVTFRGDRLTPVGSGGLGVGG